MRGKSDRGYLLFGRLPVSLGPRTAVAPNALNTHFLQNDVKPPQKQLNKLRTCATALGWRFMEPAKDGTQDCNQKAQSSFTVQLHFILRATKKRILPRCSKQTSTPPRQLQNTGKLQSYCGRLTTAPTWVVQCLLFQKKYTLTHVGPQYSRIRICLGEGPRLLSSPPLVPNFFQLHGGSVPKWPPTTWRPNPSSSVSSSQSCQSSRQIRL